MTVHLKKLSVGSETLESLVFRQKQVSDAGRPLLHPTRNWPRRKDELLNGGSLYWIIKGQMVARQPIKEFVEVAQPDGKPRCGIVLVAGLIPVWPRKVRIFQGWRYLEDADVPADMPTDDTDETPLPISLARELRELGLL